MKRTASGLKPASGHLRCISLVLLIAVMSPPRPAAAQSAGPGIQMTLGAAEVTVTGITPGGAAVFLTASIRSNYGILERTTGASEVTDDDRDGIVRLTTREIPFRAIWVAVDAETGQYTIAAPADYQVHTVDYPRDQLRGETEGILGLFDAEMYSAEVLIVRPGRGAWRIRGCDGCDQDGDRTPNGKLTLRAEDALPLGESGKAPKHLKAGDVVALIDPGRMEVFVTEIGK